MNSPPLPVDAAIIGCGISGLAARRALRQRGFSTVLFEKSRGAGGRMATRRGDGQVFDLGAQFTSAQNPHWAAVLEGAKGELKAVNLPLAEAHPRYVHQRGMSALARLLIGDDATDIHFGQRVVRVTDGGEPELTTDQGLRARPRMLLLTPPVPQSLALLDSWGHAPPAELAPLRQIEYTRCLAVIASFEGSSGLASPGLLQKPTPGLAGIYDQARKGVLTGRGTIVAHASAENSAALWDLPEPTIVDRIWSEAARHLDTLAVRIPKAEMSLHRWRYCEPRIPYPGRFFRLDRLVFAGDAFGQPSVNGAFASGEAAAEAIAEALGRTGRGGIRHEN